MLPSGVPADLIYMRFYQDEKVFRVGRVRDGMCAALYPTADKDIFGTEAAPDLETDCKRGTINRSEIGDEVWLRLLDNESIPDILKSYRNVYDDHYVLLPADDDSIWHPDHVTFRIAEDRTEK